MNSAQWVALVAVCAMGAISPGPSLAVVVRNTMDGGRAKGAAVALAHGLGIGLYAALVVAGLGLLVTTVPTVFLTLKFAGAAFLVVLAIQAFRAPPLAAAQNADNRSRSRGAVEGFLVAFLNPKIAIFFTALFSQFLHQEQTVATKAGLVAVTGGVDALWYLLVACGISNARVLAALRKHSQLLNRVFGGILLGVAIAVVWR